MQASNGMGFGIARSQNGFDSCVTASRFKGEICKCKQASAAQAPIQSIGSNGRYREGLSASIWVPACATFGLLSLVYINPSPGRVLILRYNHTV